MKFKYPSPPRQHVSWRIILCSAMPRVTTGWSGVSVDMWSYISLSISQNAVVLSPTSAWSCDSAYEMHFSPQRRFSRQCTRSNMFQL